MRRALLVAYAGLLDLCAGDPVALPHPVTGMAISVRALEGRLRSARASDLRGGVVLTVTVVASAVAAGCALERAPALVRTFAAASALAAGSLLDHAAAVLDALERGDLERARVAVAKIVGRDTAMLTESGVARAAIESLGESLCDGVVAPLLALACFGLPGALGYKAINTLDSLVGHIEAPYTHFGRAAARLDDLANLVPARLAAVLIAAASALTGSDARRALRIALRDGRRHRSPNAGFGEAAMAGALGVRLGGSVSYDGVPVEAPALGGEFRSPGSADVREAMRVVFAASVLALGAAVALAAMRE